MYIVVFITTPNKKEAETITGKLLKERLCACINIVGKIKSFFWWEKKIDCADECLLIVKTKKSLFTKLIKRVKSLHSYQTPEIIVLPIIRGDKDYLDWLDAVTR